MLTEIPRKAINIFLMLTAFLGMLIAFLPMLINIRRKRISISRIPIGIRRKAAGIPGISIGIGRKRPVLYRITSHTFPDQDIFSFLAGRLVAIFEETLW